MAGLQNGSDLAVRGSKKTGDLLGQRLVAGEPGELALPEVEIAPGQLVEVVAVVVVGGHGCTIADRQENASFADANRALSQCGIGAKVTDPT
ncbi:MAG: hypothetical protein FJX11_08980 [Alphaproteobacteria bacterium]|nr:hypothetical protein [Alphaproteobacteria bacterium]